MKKVLVVLSVLFLLAGTVNADPIAIGGDSTWNSWGSAQLSSGPFWANMSYDCGRSVTGNVGHYLSGTAGCNEPGFLDLSPVEFMPYLGQGSSTFSFTTGETSATFMQGVSAWTSDFGWFDVNTGDTYSLFNKNAQRGGTYQFSPTAQYGLYLNTQGGDWYSTMLDANGRSHFALFQSDTSWYIGIEDLDLAHNSDWDYNDLVVEIPKPVPEPASLMLLGTGLIGLATRFRKRK
jgi:hypothetical protein